MTDQTFALAVSKSINVNVRVCVEWWWGWQAVSVAWRPFGAGHEGRRSVPNGWDLPGRRLSAGETKQVDTCIVFSPFHVALSYAPCRNRGKTPSVCKGILAVWDRQGCDIHSLTTKQSLSSHSRKTSHTSAHESSQQWARRLNTHPWSIAELLCEKGFCLPS